MKNFIHMFNNVNKSDVLNSKFLKRSKDKYKLNRTILLTFYT